MITTLLASGEPTSWPDVALVAIMAASGCVIAWLFLR